MGIDYRSHWSVGYKVCASDELLDTEEVEDGLADYLDCECGDEFETFETGNAFTGETSGVFLGIKEPFKDGLDLTAAKEQLDKEIARLKLDTESEFDTIGGLYVF